MGTIWKTMILQGQLAFPCFLLVQIDAVRSA
jgi:hypothetical protein